MLATAPPSPLQFKCIDEGVVTRASLLVNGATAASALARAAAARVPVNLHLNLTEGTPVADPALVSTLLLPPAAAGGGPAAPLMRGKMGLRDALAGGAVELGHVAVEVEAQIQRFIALHPARAVPDGLDGHQHVHVLPGCAEVIADAMARHGIRQTRMPTLHAVDDLEGLDPARQSFYRAVSAQAAAAAPVYAARSIAFPDVFVGFGCMGDRCTLDRVLAKMSSLVTSLQSASGTGCGGGTATGDGSAGDATGTVVPPRVATVEWMVHPGFPVPASAPPPPPLSPAAPGVATPAAPVDTPAPPPPASSSAAAAAGVAAVPVDACAVGGAAATAAVHAASGVVAPAAAVAGCGDGPDDFSQSPDRLTELRLLTSPHLRAWLDGHGVSCNGRAVAS